MNTLDPLMQLFQKDGWRPRRSISWSVCADDALMANLTQTASSEEGGKNGGPREHWDLVDGIELVCIGVKISVHTNGLD